jgi:hypothetical protein
MRLESLTRSMDDVEGKVVGVFEALVQRGATIK